MLSTYEVLKPVRSVGDFYAMALDALVAMFKPPFAWREFLLQTWFVARVAVIPTLLLAIPGNLAPGGTQPQDWQSMLLPPG